MNNHAVEAARLTDLMHQPALDLNRLTIALRGSNACANANHAFLNAAGAVAQCAEVVAILSREAEAEEVCGRRRGRRPTLLRLLQLIRPEPWGTVPGL